MKTTLDHLPKDKQQQLRQAVEIIVATVQPDLLILFGSYARGDWVEHMEEDGIHYRYQSDMDLLAVTKTRRQATKIELNNALEDRLLAEIPTTISLIAEDIQFVNTRLTKGQYFFADIYREGILLHDSGKLTLVEPRELTMSERKTVAQTNFEYWCESSSKQKEYFDIAMSKGDFREAAFFLHQVTERLYSMILLVFTHYKPKLHDIKKLRALTASIEPQFLSAFPQSTPFERTCFKLLRHAYVDSRYNPDYHITPEQLQWLAERVSYLQTLAEKLCVEKIESFG
ncbi:HEPN domain-containing protein [Gynuella sunshinyii]|uniref:HEPN domain-containing protein n=1 Tax=Gynuella sunshinyii YC6258 TaxID=1445510 RepID=A0A0C5VC52_9GAMM|nr:HEPN domain-containing protein [Gynuella sunshinyii]AJQ96935.1 hypothetical Protein YC6258_04903 [Gynuella sunshinyii YC6258]